MTAIRSVVLGCGSYLPERILTNAELATRIDTSDEWIVQRTGIRERHVAAEGEFTSHLAIKAARAALHHARLDARTLASLASIVSDPRNTTPSNSAGPLSAVDGSIYQDRVSTFAPKAYGLEFEASLIRLLRV